MARLWKGTAVQVQDLGLSGRDRFLNPVDRPVLLAEILGDMPPRSILMLLPCVLMGIWTPLLAGARLGTVGVWLTHPEGTMRLEQQVEPLRLQRLGAPAAISIRVDRKQRFQEIEGFGFTLTGGSAQLLRVMSPSARASLLRELFGSDPTGIGTSYLRLSVGASDLNTRVFSYDDLLPGQTDPELVHFDLGPDRSDVIPVLREILAVQPRLKLMASPWSAPSWMKSNQDSRGGSLLPQWFPTYARYLVRYVEAMRDEGILIDVLTIQNEPLNPDNNPSMFMSAEDQTVFIRDHLGPAFRSARLRTRIVCYDHNADRPDYPLTVLGDPKAKSFVSGSAFHLYAGQIGAIQQVHDAHPDRGLYFTEQWIGAPGDFGGDLSWHVKEVLVGATRHWCRTVLEWNLAADPESRPHTDRGGCERCLGAVTLEGDRVSRNTAYYVIGHASKFVCPGSIRIGSTDLDSMPNVAFLTPQGRTVLIVLNQGNPTGMFSVQSGRRGFTASLSRGAVATYVWKD